MSGGATSETCGSAAAHSGKPPAYRQLPKNSGGSASASPPDSINVHPQWLIFQILFWRLLEPFSVFLINEAMLQAPGGIASLSFGEVWPVSLPLCAAAEPQVASQLKPYRYVLRPSREFIIHNAPKNKTASTHSSRVSAGGFSFSALPREISIFLSHGVFPRFAAERRLAARY